MWPCRRADHGTAMASGLDSGCWQLLNTSSCLTNGSATSGTWPEHCKSSFSLSAWASRTLGFPQGLFSIRTHLGNCEAFTMSYLSSLRLFPHTLSKLFSICQSIDKLLHISPDKYSHHQSHPWQYIWASQNKRLLNYNVTNSRSSKKWGALGPVLTYWRSHVTEKCFLLPHLLSGQSVSYVTQAQGQ